MKTKRLSPTFLLVILSGVLILANLALVGVDYLLKRSTQELSLQIENLQDNLEQLRQVDADRLASMRSEAAEAESELNLLEASFPEIGAPIALYPLSFELADRSEVTVQSISRSEQVMQETVFGLVETVQYSVEIEGNMPACISLLKRLEQAGLGTISIESIQLISEPQSCRFDVLTMGNAAQSESEN